MTSFCAESSEKNKFGWSTIFYELKGVVKAKIAQNNSQVSEGGITVKPGQDSIHELIICKVNPFVASVTNCIQMIDEVLTAIVLVYDEMENISMGEISI